MIPYVRKQKILEKLEQNDMLFIEDLANLFPEYSESTIRRDLKSLEDTNFVTLLRGGGVKFKGTSYEAPVTEKMHLNQEAKDKIAKIAASTVNNNDIIYLDSGTTIVHMVKYITATNVKIVTTNTALLVESLNPIIQSCTVLNGEVNYDLRSISGTTTDAALTDLYFDKSYLGSTGFGFDSGVNTPDTKEATKKRIVQKNSDETYLLADASKYNKRAFSKAFELNKCILITDNKIEDLDKLEYFYLHDLN